MGKKRHSLPRRMFRWFRISVLLTILAAIIAGIYLNTVGLPGFLKDRLVAKLGEEGVHVDFSRMRLRWYRGIVVDRATFTFLKYPLPPKFSALETELDLDIRSLGNSRLKLHSLGLKQADLIWPISTNQALSLSNITTKIHFNSAEEIELREFAAHFAGARITLAGSVTNVSALRAWKIFQPTPSAQTNLALARFAEVLEQFRFTGTPELRLFVSGDGADPLGFKINGRGAFPMVTSPWGNGENLQLTAQLRAVPPENTLGGGVPPQSFVQFSIASAQTPWGSGSNLNGVARLLSLATNTGVFETDWQFTGKNILANQKAGPEMARAAAAQFSVRGSHSWSNWVPTAVAGKIAFTKGEVKWGSAASGEFSFSGSTNSAPKIGDESWAAWRRAEPFRLDWDADFSDIHTAGLPMAGGSGAAAPPYRVQLARASCSGAWSAPVLKVSKLDARLYEGDLKMSGALNVATRAASLHGESSFDVQKISPLLTGYGQEWLGQFSWETAPQLAGDLSVVLPAWTNASPNWREEVLPSLVLRGKAAVGKSAFRKVPALSASTDFIYTNRTWTVPNLRVNRPEGGVDVSLVTSDETQAFQWRVHCEMDPAAIRPLLNEQQQAVFDDFGLTGPPKITCEIHGHWHELAKSAGSGEVSVQKISYRSNVIDRLSGLLLFTNQTLVVSKARLEQDKKFISVENVAWDFTAKKLFFTNVYSTVDPYLVTRLIGRTAAEAIEPYQFAEPPAVRVNGSISTGHIDDVDLHFVVDGTAFRWKKFAADRLSGRVDWVGKTLLLTNLSASAYHGGHIAGWSYFEFPPTNGADFKFDLSADDIDLQTLVRSWKGITNQIEGLVQAHMTLHSGNTRNWDSLQGTGQVKLRDGLIWDVPIFGIFSPLLNVFVPGSGNSRAREASATFLVNNGIIYSDDLEIRAPMVRLQYRGGIDFQQRVEARVQAELLHDTWVIGPIVSLALTPISKILAWQVTGNLSHPVSEPVYIPNFLMMTLRPFHTLMKPLNSLKNKLFAPEKEPPAPTPEAPNKQP